MYRAVAIAFDPAKKRIADAEAHDENEDFAVIKALTKLKDNPRGAYWHSIEIQLN